MDARTEKRLKEAKGVSVNKGKLRIAFTLAGETLDDPQKYEQLKNQT